MSRAFVCSIFVTHITCTIADVDTRDRMVVNFVDKIREKFPTSHIIYMCESNTGQESGNHWQLLRGKLNVHCLKEKADRDPGVNTNYENKQEFALMLRLRLQESALQFMKDFVCLETKNGQFEDQRAHLRQELCAQMKRCEPVQAKQVSVLSNPKIGWSGKGPNGTLNDDLVLSLCIALYHGCRFEAGTIETVDYSRFVR